MQAHLNHGAMYSNYRIAFKREYGCDWNGDNDTLEQIINEASGFGTHQEEEEHILEVMRASMNGF